MSIKHIYDRFELWWNINSFRLWASIGKASRARKFLDRIPLPAHALDEAPFRYEEKKLWGKYIDYHDKIRLITWKGFFSSLLKIAAAGVVVFVLISLADRWITRMNELEDKLTNVSIIDLQKQEKQKLQLIDGEYLSVDRRRSPVFSNDELYLPAVFKVGKKGHVFYLPVKKFNGESELLADCRIARKFMRTDGKSVYYVYTPGSEVRGRWMTQYGMARLKTAVEPGKGVLILTGEKLSRELRPGPDKESKPIYIIPGAARVEFIRFAPISSIASGLIWAQVKYTMESGKCLRGWIAVLSLEQPYVKAGTGSNTLEVIANSLTFRDNPGTGAVKIEEVGSISRGEQIEFLKFAPFSILLSSGYARIHVQYTYSDQEHSKIYNGWVAAAKIDRKLIRGIETPGANNNFNQETEDF